jgi:hypothetical protein
LAFRSLWSFQSAETISQYAPEIVYNQRQLVGTEVEVLANNVALLIIDFNDDREKTFLFS